MPREDERLQAVGFPQSDHRLLCRVLSRFQMPGSLMALAACSLRMVLAAWIYGSMSMRAGERASSRSMRRKSLTMVAPDLLKPGDLRAEPSIECRLV